MINDSIEAFEATKKAVEKLAEDKGMDITFPFDKIWEYTDEEILQTLKSGQRRRLLNIEYIETTGKMINASSQTRAGSLTPEYRLGKHFRPEARTPPSMPKPIVETLKDIEKAMAEEGFIATTEQLANFYLAIKASPLVILAGTSGTGKSKLPRLFAQFIDALFTSIHVQPQWSDNADLFGYTPSLDPDNFREGKFTQAVTQAFESPQKPVFVLLDEMNLAAVEHYFSDFLSVIETRRKTENGVITDPLPLDLPLQKNPDPYQRLRSLYLAPNMRVVGTANMDETTHIFSPKVLDRAFSIEFGDVDLTAFIETFSEKETVEKRFSWLGGSLIDPRNPISVSEVYTDSRELFTHVAGLAERIKTLLKPAGISFGFRTRDAICLYMWHWQNDKLEEILPLQDALDLCILQKILPKISGTGEGLRQALEALQDWLLHSGTAREIAKALPDTTLADDGESLTGDDDTGEIAKILISPYQRSAEKVARMLQKLNDEGAVTYWGV